MASSPKRKNRRGKSTTQKSKSGIVIIVVMGLVLVGALVAGMSSVFQVSTTASDEANTAESDGGALGGIAITDRETTYLGPNSDPTALTRAETGTTGHPTLVMFHADW